MLGKRMWIACDHDGCDERVSDGGRYAQKTIVQQIARDSGWSIGKDGDFCPRHRPRRLAVEAWRREHVRAETERP